MSDSHPQPALAGAQRAGQKNEMISRFATFFVGVAIGLMMLGLIYSARQKAAQNQPPREGLEGVLERAVQGPLARPLPAPTTAATPETAPAR